MQKYLTDLKAGEIDLSDTTIETYLHELAHTAENYFDFNYDLQTAMSYAGNQYGYSNISNAIKSYLLDKFEMDGEMCGVPMEYWKHKNGMHVNYVAQNPDGTIGGRINIIGETEDDRPVWEQSYILRNDIKYGSDIVNTDLRTYLSGLRRRSRCFYRSYETLDAAMSVWEAKARRQIPVVHKPGNESKHLHTAMFLSLCSIFYKQLIIVHSS